MKLPCYVGKNDKINEPMPFCQQVLIVNGMMKIRQHRVRIDECQGIMAAVCIDIRNESAHARSNTVSKKDLGERNAETNEP